MTDRSTRLRRRRDAALRDLLDLERQVAAGELTPDVAADLRRRYEAEAASAITASQSLDNVPPEVSENGATAAVRRRGPTGRQALYTFALVTASMAALMVPKFMAIRLGGGFVTGNEVTQQSQAEPSEASPTTRDLGSVTDMEMEKVIEANPNVIGMRLALAERYIAKGRYDLAVVHYTKVLEQDPQNAEAKAHLGWVMLMVDRPQDAARLVDAAVRSDPSLVDALWFQANVRLYGLRDTQGAVATLDTMRARRDLTPRVQRQVEMLRLVALDQGGER